MILQYTINDTSDSKSIVSSSDNYNDSKNSDMSYIPSSDDDSNFIPLPNPNKLRRNINHSKKYIQLKNNNTTGTDLNTKLHIPPKKENNTNKKKQT